LAGRGLTEALAEIAVPRLRVLASVLADGLLLLFWLGILRLFVLATSWLDGGVDLEWVVARWILGVLSILLVGVFSIWDLCAAYLVGKGQFAKVQKRVNQPREQLQENDQENKPIGDLSGRESSGGMADG
jgi:hypothetical protein